MAQAPAAFGEAAAYQRGLRQAITPYRGTGQAALAHLRSGNDIEGAAEAVRASVQETDEENHEIAHETVAIRRALDRLDAGGCDAYRATLALLPDQLREEWRGLTGAPAKHDPNEVSRTADAPGLRNFLEMEVLAWGERRQRTLTERPMIRQQAFGEALDPEPLERLSRYEVHLDRKFERTLSMLLRLQDLRRHPDGE